MYPAINSYLSALKNIHVQNSVTLDLEKFSSLKHILRGIRRKQEISGTKRLPIEVGDTFHQLSQPHTTANHDDDIMLWQHIRKLLYVWRVSELTGKQRFQGDTDLGMNDITFIRSLGKASSAKLFIKTSKSGPFPSRHEYRNRNNWAKRVCYHCPKEVFSSM